LAPPSVRQCRLGATDDDALSARRGCTAAYPLTVATDHDLGFLDYADDVAIIVRFVEAKGDPIPQAVWRLDLSAVEWPHDTPARRLYGAIYRIEDGYTPSFALDVKESHSAWGAAGGFVEVVLTLAGGAAMGVVGNAVYDALKSLAMEHRDTAMSGPITRTLTRDEAEERCRWHVEAAFGPTVALATVSQAFDAARNEYSFEFEAEDWIYSVTLTEELGLPAVVRLSRARRD